MAASFSTLTPDKYDVFVSFRGQDTRDSFTSHLYAALIRRKIKVYIGEDNLERGDGISGGILKAIKESKLSVVIFSQHYASSSWCLNELLQILRCKENSGQIAIPIYYKVDPSHVRRQQGSYGIGLSTLERHYKDKVNEWRAALTAFSNLSGWCSSDMKPESQLIDEVVQDIVKKLQLESPSDDFKGLVTIHEHVKKVESLLDISSPNVQIVGIWGVDGIGKTTLARELFERLYHQFEACCFLENVNERWERDQEKHLLRRLLSELLVEANDPHMGAIPLQTTNFAKDRLQHKKVLIVVDDVDKREQLEILVGDRDWYGPGSRIIMTSRHTELLENGDAIYRLPNLNPAESMASTSFSTLTPEMYDVFVSFRGEDTRNGFTSHLYHALIQRKVKVYVDDNIGRGHEIAAGILKAIEESKISVIVFSEYYASSSWCLDELLHILRCKLNHGQLVIPIFYKVDPSHVRKQQGSYGIGLSQLERRFYKDRVKEWRAALTALARLSGWDSACTRPESRLIDEVVQDIIKKLQPMSPRDDFKGLIGVHEHIEKVESLLDISSPTVRIVGIRGVSGIGKTTLARELFGRLYHQFEACCFLENVKERWESGQQKNLLRSLFSELLEEANDPHMGAIPLETTNFANDRLQHKKVLIVVDDVNKREQLEILVGDRDWYGPGSRIIMTSRHTELLENGDAIYRLPVLNPAEGMASTSFSTPTPEKYDVFVSFRGQDTRDSFTSHLYAALIRRKIKVYIGEDNLERGDGISGGILKAIEESKLSVVIFSEYYASSSWCLNELLQILRCKENSGQIAIPIYYKVDPSHVRRQQGSYGIGLSTLERHYKDKVNEWRVALTAFSNLSGWCSSDMKPESQLIDEVVQDIVKKLQLESPSDDFKGLVTIHEHVKKVESLLDISSPNVQIVGIWGVDGIGNTTLARELFERLYHQFEACCFLENVNERWERDQEKHLLQRLLSELLVEANDPHMGAIPLETTNFANDRLQHKKVLIVVDDVDKREQLEILVGDRDWYGPGSRIIMTSRHTELLENGDAIYRLPVLNPAEGMASTSFSTLTPEKYDVFVSFRGEDTRNGFTSHLYHALSQRKVKVYVDDNIGRGQEIAAGILKAIEESKISVIVFSEYYASSSWCLDELLHILRCKINHGQLVIPIFYKVDPSHVRKQQGSYDIGLFKLERRVYKDRVKEWRAALTALARLSGWDSACTRPESRLIDEVVQDIIKKLQLMSPRDDFKGLIGVHERIEKVESLLDISSPTVRVVGIWGMGGIGKTTLARVLFERHKHRFEACCFLEDVNRKWVKGQEKYLLRHLISDLLEEAHDLHMGAMSLRSKVKLLSKKVLIVLDHVDKSEQLEILAGDHNWFGSGSRIIVTSRHFELLKNHDAIYEVPGLNPAEGLQLFDQLAHRTSNKKDHLQWSSSVVNYANGLPLAIKVLASQLNGMSLKLGESVLRELEDVLNPLIHEVLRVSYDNLDENMKSIFLDLACFFEGDDKDFAKRILDGCGFSADRGINYLTDRSLITITDSNKLLIRSLNIEMGKEIVRQQSLREPGRRSRLWQSKDIYHIFRKNTATAKIEGISVDMSWSSELTELYVSPTAFKKMVNLRILKFRNRFLKRKLQFRQGLRFLPDALRYLYWDGYPFESLPLEFSGKNLVELKMQYSNVKQLWEGIQCLENLKAIDLSYSEQLIQVPDLSQAPNIESVTLSYCVCLREVPLYFGGLEKLTSLNLKGCSSLDKVSALPENVRNVNLKRCESLKSLPSNIYTLKSLRRLELAGCSRFDYSKKFLEFLDNLKHNSENLN